MSPLWSAFAAHAEEEVRERGALSGEVGGGEGRIWGKEGVVRVGSGLDVEEGGSRVVRERVSGWAIAKRSRGGIAVVEDVEAAGERD